MAQAVDISQLLQGSQSADAAVRTQAEQALQEFGRTNVPGFLLSLSSELANTEKAPDSRKLAGIILKNQLDAKDEAKRVLSALPPLFPAFAHTITNASLLSRDWGPDALCTSLRLSSPRGGWRWTPG
jgi:hypothetical protein